MAVTSFILGGGRILYEINAFKVPTIGSSSIEHEASTIKAFKEKGVILGDLNKWDECDFLKQFEYAGAQVKSYTCDILAIKLNKIDCCCKVSSMYTNH